MRALFFLLIFPLFAAAAPNTRGVRERLVTSALLQSEVEMRDWAQEQRDCAGFVRYVYRKAVGGKDPLWRDRKGQPQYFVTAEELVENNFVRLAPRGDGTDESIESGDLLVYYSPEKPPQDRWHVMMLLKAPSHSSRETLVIYHNGAHGYQAHVKKLWLDELRAPSLAEWNPRANNPHFMGIYRWKGLQ